jgi:hypothetical protein
MHASGPQNNNKKKEKEKESMVLTKDILWGNIGVRTHNFSFV